MWLDAFAPLHDGPAGAAASAFRPFGIRSVAMGGRRVPVVEDVPAHLSFARLRRFRGAGPDRSVLVVAPLAGSFPVLMRDLVVGLLRHAACVAVTEWPDARHVPAALGRFGFDENCLEVAQMTRALGPGAHVVGVCQGVIPALAASALLAEEGVAPLSLALLGGPVDPLRAPTRVDRILAERPLSDLAAGLTDTVPAGFPGAGRRVLPRRRQMQTFGFYLWRQALSGGELPIKLIADDGEDPFSYPLARLCWDMMDIPAEFFLETVERVFKARALPSGTLEVAGRRVRFDALVRTALLTAEAEKDDIAAPGQTVAAHDLCRAVPHDLRRRLLVPAAGHFSLFHGGRMRETVLPGCVRLMEMAEHRLG
ncbi:polyhydroxyalkanoate depolymerase [Aquabacter spiritensis]|uniref:Poly(3-hydroxybutyrate) depolymerase n=1 Tax=Aquabacter spiritensis TaxID=933073 RepID=A0A4R3M6A1_9HYPH|nr:polyhydroxyalkanoate depolymerase [Aquabacter spiritensis]TCT06785.1 poly(3-hydroxybutyrate) depolymerase [Aquabacter spiritensis]